MTPIEAARPYQLEDARSVVSWGGRAIIGHKTGLGKTLISLIILQMLQEQEGRPLKVLVAGTGSSILVWKKEIPRWLDASYIIMDGQPSVRHALWNRDYQFALVNYGTLLRDKELAKRQKFDVLITDEAHKWRNRKSKRYETLKSIKTKYFLALSATLANRGSQDVWAALNMINPSVFGSYWRFVNTFCIVDDTGFGKEIIGTKNSDSLWKLLKSRYYVSRTRQEVLPDLPPLVRTIIDLDMSPEQARMHREIGENLLTISDAGKFIVSPGSLSSVVRQRQVAVTPRLLDPNAELGAGLEYLLDAVEDDPHTVIFTCFAAAIPIIREALVESGYPASKIWSLQGKTKPEEVNTRIEGFKKGQGVMICSISFAESFALDTVKTAYVLGFSWDPAENIQAEGRLRRLDSKIMEGVQVYYIVHKGSIEDSVRSVLNEKVVNVTSFMHDQRVD